MPTAFPTAVPGLTEVEAIIRSKFESEAPQLSKVSAYLFELGGKRIRPMIALSLGQALGVNLDSQKGEQLKTIAAGIELIHLATLLHDDIIDKAPMRRHKPSAYVTYGSDDTLIAGDFLLSRAFGLCSTLPKDIVLETERACVELTEGEILEIPLYRKSSTHVVERRPFLESDFRVASPIQVGQELKVPFALFDIPLWFEIPAQGDLRNEQLRQAILEPVQGAVRQLLPALTTSGSVGSSISPWFNPNTHSADFTLDIALGLRSPHGNASGELSVENVRCHLLFGKNNNNKPLMRFLSEITLNVQGAPASQITWSLPQSRNGIHIWSGSGMEVSGATVTISNNILIGMEPIEHRETDILSLVPLINHLESKRLSDIGAISHQTFEYRYENLLDLINKRSPFVSRNALLERLRFNREGSATSHYLASISLPPVPSEALR
jgi:hypothetical protein